MVRWTDTDQGNVELLAMKTLSETRLEGGPSDNGSVEEGKKESVDGGGREELGALTANTFGFQGEVVKNEEKLQVVKCHIHNSTVCHQSDLVSLSPCSQFPLMNLLSQLHLPPQLKPHLLRWVCWKMAPWLLAR